MTTKDKQPLQDFLATFQVIELGRGDSIAGANLLASMACVLADLAPTDGSFNTKQGNPARLRTNLFISGPATTGLILDEVITEVGQRQNNLVAHLRHYIDYLEEQKAKMGAVLPPMGPDENDASTAFVATQSGTDPLLGSREDQWWPVLNEAPPENVMELSRRPKFLVSASNPRDLEAQLQRTRPGGPLVHLGLTHPRDLAEFASLGTALLEGRYAPGNRDELIRASLLVTDSMGMIEEIARAPDERTAWLGHFLWLCDGNAGPELPEAATPGQAGQPEATSARFRNALDLVITLRLNMPSKEYINSKIDTLGATYRWTTFLREMEPHLPGISAAARNLLDSLIFGFVRMACVQPELKFQLAGVEAFARFLVRRMANARAVLLHEGAIAQRRGQIERIVRKLSHGPAPARTLYRALRLTAAECDECLQWLESANLINRRADKHWELAPGARLDFDDCSAPLLEV